MHRRRDARHKALTKFRRIMAGERVRPLTAIQMAALRPKERERLRIYSTGRFGALSAEPGEANSTSGFIHPQERQRGFNGTPGSSAHNSK